MKSTPVICNLEVEPSPGLGTPILSANHLAAILVSIVILANCVTIPM
jgi:hypothetical protein